MRKIHSKKNDNSKEPKKIIFRTKRTYKKENELDIYNNNSLVFPNDFISIKIIDIKNEVFQQIEDFYYYPNYIIGSGGTMKVYYGIQKDNKFEVAIKIDKEKKRRSSTINEAIILTRLKGIEQIPFFHDYYLYNNNNIIVENLVGPSLRKILEFPGFEFDLVTVSFLGIQMINILKLIHERFIIHNDIKPNNICLGIFEKGKFDKLDKFFLIDFGYSKEFMINKNIYPDKSKNVKMIKTHYENKIENTFQGTAEFMAISISEGYRASRRTDLEELIYTLIFLLKKTLPWSNIRGKIMPKHAKKCAKLKKVLQ